MEELFAILATATPKKILIEQLRDNCQNYLDGKDENTTKIRLSLLMLSINEESNGDVEKAMELLHCNGEKKPEAGQSEDQG